MSLGTVCLVGSPNAGKSTIFNRFVGARKAIVEDTPGVTRDRIYGTCEWLTKSFTVIDTGGVEVKNAPFQVEIRAQVQLALDEADLIVFIVDGKKGVTGDDEVVAKMLYKSDKPVIVAVNKIDRIEDIAATTDFYAFGLGEPMAVSGEHGIGIGDLLDKIVSMLPEKETPDYGEAITFSLIGRPNVGKSSLSNAILGKERSIVKDISGTTRDSIDTPFRKDGQDYVLIDTAGLVKRGMIYEAIDKYAAIRALSAIERSEVVLLLIDAETGIREQDAHVVGYAIDKKKAVILVVNKWDLAATGQTQEEFKKDIATRFKFLDYATVLFVSAKTGRGISAILPAIQKAHESFHRRVPTSVLNKIVLDAQAMNPTPEFNHGRLKIVYASQVAVAPPTFVMFCNDPKFAHFSYTRYLENRMRETFDFEGSPLNIIYRQRK